MRDRHFYFVFCCWLLIPIHKQLWTIYGYNSLQLRMQIHKLTLNTQIPTKFARNCSVVQLFFFCVPSIRFVSRLKCTMKMKTSQSKPFSKGKLALEHFFFSFLRLNSRLWLLNLMPIFEFRSSNRAIVNERNVCVWECVVKMWNAWTCQWNVLVNSFGFSMLSAHTHTHTNRRRRRQPTKANTSKPSKYLCVCVCFGRIFWPNLTLCTN